MQGDWFSCITKLPLDSNSPTVEWLNSLNVTEFIKKWPVQKCHRLKDCLKIFTEPIHISFFIKDWIAESFSINLMSVSK